MTNAKTAKSTMCFCSLIYLAAFTEYDFAMRVPYE